MQGTGCKILDEILGSYSGMTMIYGEASTGKTTLAKMAAVEYSREGKVVFLDTEKGFNTDRIKQITPDFKNVMNNILLITARNFYQQHKAITEIGSIKKTSLIVVDTIGAHYRLTVKKDYKKANNILRKQVSILKEVSQTIPVIIITQVYSNIKSGLLSPIGGKIVTKYADNIIRMEKKPRRMIIEKPFSKDALFEIKKEGISKI